MNFSPHKMVGPCAGLSIPPYKMEGWWKTVVDAHGFLLANNIELSLQCCAPFVAFMYQKWSETVSFSFFFKPSSRYSLGRILSTTWSPIRSRRATAETETLQRRPWTATLHKKKVSRLRAFPSLKSHVPDRLHVPTTWWWCGWHDDWDDDVVAMTASHDNCP